MNEKETPSQEAMRLFSFGKYETAHSVLMRGLLSAPDDAEIALALALTLGKLGRHKECLQQWQYLRLHHPTLYGSGSKLQHAEALIEAGSFEDAEILLKECDARGRYAGRRQELIDLLLERIADATTGTTVAPTYRPASQPSVRPRMTGAASIVEANKGMKAEYNSLVENAPAAVADLAFKSIIVVTYGRTGSTLLQGILNSINGVCVLGENEGAFYHLFEFLQATRRLSTMARTELPSSPFFGAGSLDPQALHEQLKSAVDTFFQPFRRDPNVSCIGFKEIRFKDHPETLHDYLEFLEDTFPKPAFLFLWREHEQVLRSGWWKAEDRVSASNLLTEVEENARSFAAGKENCFELTYQDLAEKSHRLEELFEFLQAPYDEKRIARVLNIPHSYDPQTPEIRDLFRNAGSQE